VSHPVLTGEWMGATASGRLPIAFTYPISEIILRGLIGLVLFALGWKLLSHVTTVYSLAGFALSLFGGLVAGSNLRALLDEEWRSIVVDRDGVEIRYGFSHRRYRFLDYSEYRISRIGLRRFLTAVPCDVEDTLGRHVGTARLTIFDRPALIAPVPLFDRNASLALMELQSLLNSLRSAALSVTTVKK
jgi:hypothetical protein